MFKEFIKLIQVISSLDFMISVHFIVIFACTRHCVKSRGHQHLASTTVSGKSQLWAPATLLVPMCPDIPKVMYLALSLLLNLYICSLKFLASHFLLMYCHRCLYHSTENTWKVLVSTSSDVFLGNSLSCASFVFLLGVAMLDTLIRLGLPWPRPLQCWPPLSEALTAGLPSAGFPQGCLLPFLFPNSPWLFKTYVPSSVPTMTTLIPPIAPSLDARVDWHHAHNSASCQINYLIVTKMLNSKLSQTELTIPFSSLTWSQFPFPMALSYVTTLLWTLPPSWKVTIIIIISSHSSPVTVEDLPSLRKRFRTLQSVTLSLTDSHLRSPLTGQPSHPELVSLLFSLLPCFSWQSSPVSTTYFTKHKSEQ